MIRSRAAAKAVTWLCVAFAPGSAQIGTGWAEYFPTTTLQQENSANHSTYTDVDGVESFKMWKNPSGARQRCEIRVNDNYTAGRTQFEGEFFMVRGGGRVSIMQVWLSVIVPVTEADGGSIVWWNKLLIDNLYGRWVRINVFHDADRRFCEIWFDGVKKGEHEVKSSNPYYHKYGLYNEAETNPEIRYRKVRYFKDGRMEGGTSIAMRSVMTGGLGKRLAILGSSPVIAIKNPRIHGQALLFGLNGNRLSNLKE